MSENKTPDKNAGKEHNVTKIETVKAVKPKRKLGWSWWVALLVLIVVVITFIFSGIGLDTLFTDSAYKGITFGKYGKQDITFAPNNYFYDQYQNIATQYSRSNNASGTQAAYEIWWNAFQNTVFFTAVTQMADAAGIIATEENVNKAIIDSGVYNKNGKFDTATYNAASIEYKTQVEREYNRSVPFTTVINDIATVVSSKAEGEYVGKMAASTRSFDYVMFDASSYPDDLAIKYAMNDPQQFVSLDVAMIAISTEEVATQVAAAIADGSMTYEQALAQYNEDSSLNAEGKLGFNLPYFSLATNFNNPEEVNVLFASSIGSVVGPYVSPYGYYYIYKVDSAPIAPDFSDPLTILMAKQYLAQNESEVISSYAQEQAQAFATAAKKDFDAALDEFNPAVMTVTATPENFGGSTYMTSFAYSDTAGGLATAASDKAVMKQLYTEPVKSVIGPIKSGTNYVVAEITEATDSVSTSDYVSMFYGYMAGNQNQQDLIQSVFNSDKFENNFLNVFFKDILGY